MRPRGAHALDHDSSKGNNSITIRNSWKIRISWKIKKSIEQFIVTGRKGERSKKKGKIKLERKIGRKE